MHRSGFTLYELLITLSIGSILITLAVPGLSAYATRTQVLSVTQKLTRTIELSRTVAVSTNSRAVLASTNGRWHEGWALFIDSDNDGILSGQEVAIISEGASESVVVSSGAPINRYISFVGTGESRQINGSLLMGTLKICPVNEGEGFSLVLSQGGRTRIASLNAAECGIVRSQN